MVFICSGSDTKLLSNWTFSHIAAILYISVPEICVRACVCVYFRLDAPGECRDSLHSSSLCLTGSQASWSHPVSHLVSWAHPLWKMPIWTQLPTWWVCVCVCMCVRKRKFFTQLCGEYLGCFCTRACARLRSHTLSRKGGWNKVEGFHILLNFSTGAASHREFSFSTFGLTVIAWNPLNMWWWWLGGGEAELEQE